MFQLLEEPTNGVLALRITGNVDDRETDRIVRIVETRASRHGKVQLFLFMPHYASFNSAESLYEDLRFVRRCENFITRIAVVGDRPWKDTWVALFGLFSGIDVAYFDQAQTEKALQWLQATSP